MTARSLLVAACLLAMGSQVVGAQQVSPAGTVVGTSVDLGVRTIPVPQGRWTVVSTEEGQSHDRRAILAELDRNVLSRWIYASTNAEYNPGGWSRNKDICDRKNVHFAYSDSSNNNKDIECWMVSHRGMTMNNHPAQLTINFYRWSDTLGRPNTAVGVSYYFVKNGNFLRLDVWYNPVADGFPETPTAEERGSPWHPDVASKDPQKLAYLRALKTMGEQYFNVLRNVFH